MKIEKPEGSLIAIRKASVRASTPPDSRQVELDLLFIMRNSLDRSSDHLDKNRSSWSIGPILASERVMLQRLDSHSVFCFTNVSTSPWDVARFAALFAQAGLYSGLNVKKPCYSCLVKGLTKNCSIFAGILSSVCLQGNSYFEQFIVALLFIIVVFTSFG